MDETGWRIAVFFGLLAFMMAWEVLAPARKDLPGRWPRWGVNGVLMVSGILAARLSVGALAVLSAQWSGQNNIGAFTHVDVPPAVLLIGTIILLDMAIYAQHVAFHKAPLLWRLHKVHHCDRGFDVTTAVRFHPIEILLSLVYKSSVIVLIGPDVWMVIVYEILLNGFALFNHGNVRLPKALEKPVRWVVVTPDMHRVHHSVMESETNSNYGNIFSVWDRLFGTYVVKPASGQERMRIGLADVPEEHNRTWWHILILPFRPVRDEKG